MDKNTFTMEKRKYELVYDKHKQTEKEKEIDGTGKIKIQDYFKDNLNIKEGKK
jgi:hypothetical protein